MRTVRLVRFVFVVGLSLCLLPAGASAQGKDMVAGTAHFAQYDPDVHVHVNATSDPDGANARGWWRYDVGAGGPYDFAGEVTCLNVDGNSAILSGVITTDEQFGTYFQQFVQDAGAPGVVGDNSVTLWVGLAEDPGCDVLVGDGIPATGGNYVVKDVTP